MSHDSQRRAARAARSAHNAHDRTSRPGTWFRIAVVAIVAALAVIIVVRRPGATPPSVAQATEATAVVSLPRLVDIGADKCIPCKAMAPAKSGATVNKAWYQRSLMPRVLIKIKVVLLL